MKSLSKMRQEVFQFSAKGLLKLHVKRIIEVKGAAEPDATDARVFFAPATPMYLYSTPVSCTAFDPIVKCRSLAVTTSQDN